MSSKLKICILSGGPSSERLISIQTAGEIKKSLSNTNYQVSVLILKKKGREILNQLKVLKTDLAFIAIHGKLGEDGTLQAMLETLGIPYTGSGVLASAWAMDKAKTLYSVASLGIAVPNFVLVRKQSRRSEVLKGIKKIGFPCVVKPNQSGSSIGVAIVKTEKELNKALNNAFAEGDNVSIEQYIKGREFSCAVLGNSKDKINLLPPIEIVTPAKKFFDYKEKYFSKETKEICPAPVTKRQDKTIREYAARIHTFLGCDGLTRSDFILNNKNKKIYFLEINTAPGQTKMSLAPKEALTAGMDFTTFVQKQIELALQKP